MKILANILVILCVTTSAFGQRIVVKSGVESTTYTDVDQYLMAHSSKEGYWEIFDANNLLFEEGPYVENKKNGKWMRYFYNGKRSEEVNYVNDKPYGRMVFYYETGGVREEGTWIDRHWVGEYRMFYENGIPQYVWLFDEAGSRTGSQMYLYENGTTMIEGDWKAGLETGTIKEYFDDGSLKSEKNYSAGIVDSVSVKMYQPKAKIPEPVVLTGAVPENDSLKHFYGNGYFCTKNKFNKKDFDGIWKNGKYFDGQKFIYDEKGKLTKIYIYRNGVKVGDKEPE